ncbi:MAG: hypothetical protein HWN68_09985, partial [Desulfobacterales bacterium]|nr:hypothetical protein [Desulfobacterales bacterium]
MTSALESLPEKKTALDSLPDLKLSSLESLPEDYPKPMEYGVRDPSEPTMKGYKPETTSAIPRFVKKGFWSGMGAIAWPFERVSGAIATPLADSKKIAQAQQKAMGQLPMFMPEEEYGQKLMDAAKAGAKVAPEVLAESAKTIGKSLISKKMPEEATTITELVGDVYGDYYRAMIGEEPPSWYPAVMGGAADFLITPWALSKAVKGVGQAAKVSPIGKAIGAYKIPEWQRMKLRTRARTGARIERATELGKTVRPKELKSVAKELSKRTGTKITPEAVGQRITQITKGGITEQPALQKLANPIIAEFRSNAQELRRLGILGRETYTTKLSKSRINELLKRKQQLQSQIDKLKKWPARTAGAVSAKTGKPLQRRFPGQARKVQELQNKIDDITNKIHASYETGGMEYFPRMYESKEAER